MDVMASVAAATVLIGLIAQIISSLRLMDATDAELFSTHSRFQDDEVKARINKVF